jgi:hypothetical protein
MAAIISSEARWLTSARPDQGAIARAAALSRPAEPAPADHRSQRRLGRKCASVLAGASLSLGLAAARIPTASARSGPVQAQQGQAAQYDRPIR